MPREEVRFDSGGDQCAAWLYRPADAPNAVPCVVMAHGFSFTRHEGLAHFAEAFASAGIAALVFDFRYLGDSGGEPRQRFRKAAQVEDYRNAIAFARGVAGVDPERIVLWGYSFSAGHVVGLIARGERVAASLVLDPYLNGLRRVIGTPPGLIAWILPRAIADVLGRHNLIPVTARPGERGAMTFPGEFEGFMSVIAPESPWRNEISPGIFTTAALHRPGLRARRISKPVWVGLGERDVSVDSRAIERFAEKLPDAELHRYPYDHFESFLTPNAALVAGDQVEFLRRRGLAAPLA